MQYFRFHHRQFARILFLIALSWQTGCLQYQRYPISKARMPKLDERNLTFYLVDAAHPLSRSWQVFNYQIGERSMRVFLARLTEVESAQVNIVRNNRAAKDKKNEVLLFAKPEYAQNLPDTLTTILDFDQLEKIEVYEMNFGRTLAYSVPTLVGAGLVLTIIAIGLKGSCPFVYTQNPDGSCYFEGELYSGATYPQLERHDWLPLPDLVANAGSYQIRLSNQAKEIQNTNLLELVAVDHPAGTDVLFDQFGRLQTYQMPKEAAIPLKSRKCGVGEPDVLSQPQSPCKAVDYDGRDARPALAYQDSLFWHGDPNNARPRAEENLTMTFLKPEHASTGRLVIRAKNTFWLDYLYGLFLDEFGEYSGYVRKQYLKKSGDDIRKWMDEQNIPLRVSLQTSPGKWKPVGSFHLAGPMALKKDVLEIDLSQVEGKTVQIDLEAGFMFWEIDWVVLDCSEPVPVTVQTIQPGTALSLTGMDVAAALSRDDDQYYSQPQLGDEAMVHFPVLPQAPGTVRSLLLHAKGHYEILRDPVPGKPNVFYLRQFDQPDALPNYSRRRWQELMVTPPAPGAI
ncbi:MAG: hypothetical protein ABIO24_03910 [Saprospiraceae bacterium]